MYRNLKRTWTHGDINYIPKFVETFPELKKIPSEEMCDRFRKLKLDFYTEEKKPVPQLLRFTMPFAIILMFLMLIGVPFLFLITGEWKYPLGEKNRILNWFRALRLL
jgi:hypothetical protein